MSLISGRILARGIASAALCAGASIAHAHDYRNAPAFLPLGEETAAPRGFVDMCAGGEMRELCSPVKAVLSNPALATGAIGRSSLPFARYEANTASSTLDANAMLKRVNRYVNRRVRQQTDTQIFGVDEVWRRSGVGPDARGDCEDIAIEKRMQLIAEGFPRDRLAFAVVFSRASGLHTILIARTDEGDVVLDNRSPYVQKWTEVGYTWLSIQMMGDAMNWRALDHAA